ncbi:hypothetical protein SUGI_0357820 [Cryptomeria japonica]|nr:hypothetical protein SUGI_0357820 [Cryptomeria japonica]
MMTWHCTVRMDELRGTGDVVYESLRVCRVVGSRQLTGLCVAVVGDGALPEVFVGGGVCVPTGGRGLPEAEKRQFPEGGLNGWRQRQRRQEYAACGATDGYRYVARVTVPTTESSAKCCRRKTSVFNSD